MNDLTDSTHHLQVKIQIINSCVLLLHCSLTPCNLLYASRSEPLCGAPAVHHDMKNRLLLGQHGKKHTEQNGAHLQKLMVFTELFLTGTKKALQGPKRLSSVPRSPLPLPKTLVRLHVVNSTETNKQCKSSSHQGTGRSEERMLISMWEQQRCPCIMTDCVKFRLEEPLRGKKGPSYSKRSCGKTNDANYLIDNENV